MTLNDSRSSGMGPTGYTGQNPKRTTKRHRAVTRQAGGLFTARAVLLNRALNSRSPLSSARQSSRQSLAREIEQNGARVVSVKAAELPALLESRQVARNTVPDVPARGQ